jgi:hypothetical protein
MSIRISTHDNMRQPVQVAVSKGTIVTIFAVSTAGYADPKLLPRILCESI